MLEQRFFHSEGEDRDAVHAAFDHAAYGEFHSFRIVHGGGEQNFVIVLDGEGFKGLHNFGEKRIGDFGNDQAEDRGCGRRQARAPGDSENSRARRSLSRRAWQVARPRCRLDSRCVKTVAVETRARLGDVANIHESSSVTDACCGVRREYTLSKSVANGNCKVGWWRSQDTGSAECCNSRGRMVNVYSRIEYNQERRRAREIPRASQFLAEGWMHAWGLRDGARERSKFRTGRNHHG